MRPRVFDSDDGLIGERLQELFLPLGELVLTGHQDLEGTNAPSRPLPMAR